MSEERPQRPDDLPPGPPAYLYGRDPNAGRWSGLGCTLLLVALFVLGAGVLLSVGADHFASLIAAKIGCP